MCLNRPFIQQATAINGQPSYSEAASEDKLTVSEVSELSSALMGHLIALLGGRHKPQQ